MNEETKQEVEFKFEDFGRKKMGSQVYSGTQE